MSRVRITLPHGYFKVGEVYEVRDIIEHPHYRHKIQYLVLAKGHTIPKENTSWLS